MAPTTESTTAAVILLSLPPSYRAGLAAALAASGHDLTDDRAAADVAVVGLRSAASCEIVEDLVGTGTPVVALVEHFDRDAAGHALYHRAAPADWDAEPSHVVEIVEAALRGSIVVPLAFGEALAARGPHSGDGVPSLTAEEARWLRDLSHGATVTRIADEYGYSERAMFRRLHELYTRLGVSGRAQALVAAQRLGLLDP